MIKVIVVIVSTANMHHCFLSGSILNKNLTPQRGNPHNNPVRELVYSSRFTVGSLRHREVK